jgi:hypothetical protein
MKTRIFVFLTIVAVAVSSSATDNNYRIMKDATKGFKIVAVINGKERVLAYGDREFDTTIPGVKWWFNCLKQLPAEKLSEPKTSTPASLGFPETCEPLVKTTWGQGAPYNWMCPEPNYAPWGGFLPEAEHCPVGCVATATAQIMNYYQWPIHGQGSHSVNPEQLAGTTVYTVDFSEATYDWDNMLDSYKGEYTLEQAQAVAQLCYHVGVASNMGYMAEASATDNYYALVAMQEYFGYKSEGLQNIERPQYSEQEWMRLVYTELSEGRPILYEAIGIDLGTYGVYGHSFIIDGYDSNGLVHVNWGWNGNSDDYYDIALLNPQDLHFDDYQMMAIGICPDRQTNENPCDVNCDGAVTASDVTALYNYLLNGDETFIDTCDVNGDGYITSADVTVVYNYLLGI